VLLHLPVLVLVLVLARHHPYGFYQQSPLLLLLLLHHPRITGRPRLIGILRDSEKCRLLDPRVPYSPCLLMEPLCPMVRTSIILDFYLHSLFRLYNVHDVSVPTVLVLYPV
jgi:hypothetical protein